MNISTTKHNGFMSRFAAIAALLVFSLVALAQENVLKIADFKVIPGATATVEVVLDNPTPVSSLQFDVQMPEGLTIVGFNKVTSRITRSSHTLMNAELNGKNRMGFLSNATDMSQSAIKLSSGAFATIEVKADATFAGGEIKISDIVASNGTVEIDENEVDINETWTTKVGIFVGTLSFVDEEVALKDGETAVVGINLDNKINISAIQATISLPEGVEFTEGTEGEWFEYTNRLPDNTTITIKPLTNGKYQLLIGSLTNDDFEGFAGELFALNLKAKGLKADGEVVISNIKGTNKYGISYEIDDIALPVKYVSVPAYDDPTQDGLWNVNDIDAVINAVLSGLGDTIYDVDGNGKVTIDDVDETIKKVFN